MIARLKHIALGLGGLAVAGLIVSIWAAALAWVLGGDPPSVGVLAQSLGAIMVIFGPIIAFIAGFLPVENP